MNVMSKVLCIVRASTEKQEVESQKQELIEFARRNGFENSDMVFIVAQGASARSLNRKYIQMLEEVKSTILHDDKIKTVALWSLNRLGRVESKLHEMKEFFVGHHIQVLCKDPSFRLLKDDGTEDTAGGMMFSVYSAMVKLDTEEMFAKFTRGKKRNVDNGKYNGGKVPFGYKVNDDKYIVIDQENAEIVKRIFTEYASGKWSFSTLCKELNSRGNTHDGKRFCYTWLKDCINSKSYIGEGKEGYGTVRHYQPIISKELFLKCQEVKESHILGEITKARQVNLSLKKIKCSSCGGNYLSTGTWYVCYHHRYLKTCCNPVTIPKEVIDKLTFTVAARLHLDFLLSSNSEALARLKENRNVTASKVATMEKSLEAFDANENRIVDAYIDGTLSKQRYKDKIAKVKMERETAKAQVMSLKKELSSIDSSIDALEHPSFDDLRNLSKGIWDETDAKKKEIIDAHIKVIYLDQEKLNGRKSTRIRMYDTLGNLHLFHYIPFLRELDKVFIDKGGKVQRFPLGFSLAAKAEEAWKKLMELYKGGKRKGLSEETNKIIEGLVQEAVDGFEVFV